MPGLIIRLLMLIAGIITSFFISREALNFSIVQTVIAVLLFALVIIVITFWTTLSAWFKRISSKRKKF